MSEFWCFNCKNVILLYSVFDDVFSNFDRIQLTLMSQVTMLRFSIAVEVNITV